MISDKFDRNENPDWEPDALVEVVFSRDNVTVKNGYRPQYKVEEDYHTTTHHWFIENGEALPNQPTQAFVKFITPEAYPNCLVAHKEIEIYEGTMLVGKAIILEVYNGLLSKRS